MKKKKILTRLSIIVGVVLLIIEISSKEKNYYLQSIGIVLLMLGLFMVNATLASRTEMKEDEFLDEEE